MLDKFAEELKAAREKNGFSLQQLATKTRIDLKFLEAIDNGNFAFLPDLYVKAFIKQYAKTVGLDENLMIKKFDAAKEGREYSPEEPPDAKLVHTEPVRPEVPKNLPVKGTAQKTFFENPLEKNSEDEGKTKKGAIISVLSGFAVIILILLLYIFVFDKSDKIIVEETPYEEVTGQNTERYEDETPEAGLRDSAAIPVEGDSLYLTFYAEETSWIYVILDDKLVREYTLSPKSKITLAAAGNFKGTVGNSGGVTLQLNSSPVEFSGRSGSVRHFKLDRNEFIYLNAPPKPEQQ